MSSEAAILFGRDDVAGEHHRTVVGGADALEDHHRVARVQVERHRVLLGGAFRVHGRLDRSRPHPRRRDRIGDTEVHVEVVPQTRSIGRVGARPTRAGHEAVFLEGAERLSQGGPRHPHLLREHGLGRQLRPRGDMPRAHARRQLVPDPEGQTLLQRRAPLDQRSVGAASSSTLLCLTNSVNRRPSSPLLFIAGLRWDDGAVGRRRPEVASTVDRMGLVAVPRDRFRARRRPSEPSGSGSGHPYSWLRSPSGPSSRGSSTRGALCRRSRSGPRSAAASRGLVPTGPGDDPASTRLTDKPSMWLDTR